jgi:hypothetical protein
VAFRTKDSACLSPKLLRNMPAAESQSVSCGSMRMKIPNAGAQKKE